MPNGRVNAQARLQTVAGARVPFITRRLAKVQEPYVLLELHKHAG